MLSPGVNSYICFRSVIECSQLIGVPLMSRIFTDLIISVINPYTH
jgi:hypothetical protein